MYSKFLMHKTLIYQIIKSKVISFKINTIFIKIHHTFRIYNLIQIYEKIKCLRVKNQALFQHQKTPRHYKNQVTRPILTPLTSVINKYQIKLLLLFFITNQASLSHQDTLAHNRWGKEQMTLD